MMGFELGKVMVEGFLFREGVGLWLGLDVVNRRLERLERRDWLMEFGSVEVRREMGGGVWGVMR